MWDPATQWAANDFEGNASLGSTQSQTSLDSTTTPNNQAMEGQLLVQKGPPRSPGANFERKVNPLESFDQSRGLQNDFATLERDMFSIPEGRALIRNHPDFYNWQRGLPGFEFAGMLIDRHTGRLIDVFISSAPPLVNRSKTQIVPYKRTAIRSPHLFE